MRIAIKFFFCMPLIIIGVNAMISCTSFQEEEISVSFGVNTTELSFLTDGDSRSVTVSSGTKWDVSGMPSWISLGAINRSGHSPYEWIVNFSAAGNDEYNRDGTIIIKSGLDVAEIAVTQEGKKGRYIAVESISVSPKELTLTEGENASLIFSISPVNASIKDVTWKSSSPSVATVSENGIIEALAVGATTITATTEDGGKTASCDVTVQSKVISAESVSLDKTELVMKLGETHALIATVNPSSATNKEVIWTSTDSKVAAVSSSGVVTAKGYGTATIRVATVDGGFTADCHVGVYTPIQDLSISMPTSLTITEGETGLLSVNINVDIEDVHIDPLLELYSKWVVEDESIVSIQWEDSNSLRAQLRALSVGTTRVTNILKDRFGSMTLSCDVTVVKTKVPVTGVSLNAPSISMTIGDTQTLSATVIPSNATDKSVTWSSSNTSVATVFSSGVVTAKAAGSATITVTTNDGSKTASCSVVVVSDSFDYVDLGLPSGLKWATCNIGASSPEEYGDEYAWGETETKSYDSFSNWNYKWYSSGTLTKYNNIDKKTVLEETDDVAHVKLGGTWRIPTDAEWTELRTQCSWTWTRLNGRSGRLVTGKNGNSIFLPAAGASGNIPRYYAGTYGNYWSSSLNTGDIYEAWYVTFDSDNVYRDSYTRYVGISVRAVTE